MLIVNTLDFSVTVTRLGNKTNTQYVKNSYVLLIKFCLQYNFTIEMTKMLPKIECFDPNLALTHTKQLK